MTDEKSPFVDVILLEAVRQISVMKAIDRHSDLNLKQAKKLVESAPVTIFEHMPRAQAVAITLELEA